LVVTKHASRARKSVSRRGSARRDLSTALGRKVRPVKHGTTYIGAKKNKRQITRALRKQRKAAHR
jgi:hypothetical protein